MMIFNIRPGGIAEQQGGAIGWFIGVGQDGAIETNLQFDAPSQDVRALPNGNLLISLTTTGVISGARMTIAGVRSMKKPTTSRKAVSISSSRNWFSVMADRLTTSCCGIMLAVNSQASTLANASSSITTPVSLPVAMQKPTPTSSARY